MICMNSGIPLHISASSTRPTTGPGIWVCLFIYYVEESLEEDSCLEGGKKREGDVAFQGAALSYGNVCRWRSGVNTYAAEMNISV